MSPRCLRAERLQADAADLAQENVALLAELLHLRGTAVEKRAALDEITRLHEARCMPVGCERNIRSFAIMRAYTKSLRPLIPYTISTK